MREGAFIAALRDAAPLHPGARGLHDDAAVLGDHVVTTDTLVEGVHFLPGDAPADVAWKLVAQNLSDLAGKGALPVAATLNYPLRDADWDAAFARGFADALAAMDCALLGGDTVALPAGAPRILTLTAFGRGAAAPPRGGARAGDALWVTGTIGDAGAGLAIARGADGPAALLARYHRPVPRVREGRAIAPHATAMMDVSDGLLIDAARMAATGGLRVHIDLDRVPLSDAYRAHGGDALTAACAGDDYELLFALPPGVRPPVPATAVGGFAVGAGLSLTRAGAPVAVPERLGWEHGAPPPSMPLAHPRDARYP